MLHPTMLEDTTLLERRSLIWSWTRFVDWLINALDSKDSSCTTLLEEELALAMLLFSWSDCPLTIQRSPSSHSVFTQHQWSALLLLSHTMLCSPLMLCWSTLMLTLSLTMRLFMTFASGEFYYF